MDSNAFLQRVRRLPETNTVDPPTERSQIPENAPAMPPVEPPSPGVERPPSVSSWQTATPAEAEANFRRLHGMSPDEWWTDYAGEIGAVVPWSRDGGGAQ